MAETKAKQPANFIVPLIMNGLQGRMLRLPAPKNKTKEILFVYDHLSNLEHWWNFALELNRYGGVTIPDLPGFGGMESFYKLGEKPTIDRLADYLASFIKLRYKRKKVTVLALGFGFVVVTRTLQRYPDLISKVEVLISLSGYAHKDDFTLSSPVRLLKRSSAALFALQLPATFYANVCLHPWLLRLGYTHGRKAKQKFHSLAGAERQAAIHSAIQSWRTADVRTHMSTTAETYSLDNCRIQIELPLWHVRLDSDERFDRFLVEQHLRIVYGKVTARQARLKPAEGVSLFTQAAAAKLLPAPIRKVLASN